MNNPKMKNTKKNSVNWSEDPEAINSENKIPELNEGDLEQISGGTPNTTGTTTTSTTTTGVQKDKLKTANKNSEEMKKLL